MTSKSCGFVDKYLTDDGGYIEGFKLNICTFLILFSYNYVSIESFDGIKRSLIFKSCPKKKFQFEKCHYSKYPKSDIIQNTPKRSHIFGLFFVRIFLTKN